MPQEEAKTSRMANYKISREWPGRSSSADGAGAVSGGETYWIMRRGGGGREGGRAG